MRTKTNFRLVRVSSVEGRDDFSMIVEGLGREARFRVPDVLVMSARAGARLTPEQQGWIDRAAAESAVYQRALWAEETRHALDQLRAAGVEITMPDRAVFAAHTARVYESRRETPLGQWAARLRSAAQALPPSSP